MADESVERDLVELASAAIEDAARTLPPLPLPVIDAAAIEDVLALSVSFPDPQLPETAHRLWAATDHAMAFGPVPERVEVTYTTQEPASGVYCPDCVTPRRGLPPARRA